MREGGNNDRSGCLSTLYGDITNLRGVALFVDSLQPRMFPFVHLPKIVSPDIGLSHCPLSELRARDHFRPLPEKGRASEALHI